MEKKKGKKKEKDDKLNFKKEVLELKILVYKKQRRVSQSYFVVSFVTGSYINYDRYGGLGIEDSYRKQMSFMDRTILLDITDFTTWQPEMLPLYAERIDAVILTYSIDKDWEESQQAVREAHADIMHIRAKNPSLPPLWFVLVALKADLEQQRKISYEQGHNLANELGCVAFFESSNEKMQNITEPFEAILKPVIEMEQRTGKSWRPETILHTPPGCHVDKPKRQRAMATDMATLINSETYHDMVLVAEGREIKVSRAILLVRQSSILEGYGPKDYRVEMNENVSYDNLMKIVEWIYTGKFQAPPYKTEARRAMREAALRCRAYHLLPYLSMDDDAEEKEKEREEQLFSNREQRGPSFGVIFNASPFSDITLVFDDKNSLLAHRILLVARSPYFRAMFEGGFKETDQQQVSLQDVAYAPFKLLLYFMYTDDLDGCEGVTYEEHIEALLRLSDLYGIPTLASAIEVKLFEAMQISNAASIYYIAHSNAAAMQQLKEHAEHFIKYRFQHVSTTPEFKQLPQEMRDHLQQRAVPGNWLTGEEDKEGTKPTTAKKGFFSSLRGK